MLNEFREWLMLVAELFICYMLVLEYKYDEKKDIDKKQKRTRTTKKTTTTPSGETITEESSESIESKGDEEVKK